MGNDDWNLIGGMVLAYFITMIAQGAEQEKQKQANQVTFMQQEQLPYVPVQYVPLNVVYTDDTLINEDELIIKEKDETYFFPGLMILVDNANLTPSEVILQDVNVNLGQTVLIDNTLQQESSVNVDNSVPSIESLDSNQCMPRYCEPNTPTDGEKRYMRSLLLGVIASLMACKPRLEILKEGES